MIIFLLLFYFLFPVQLRAESIEDIESALMEKRFDDARHLAYDFASQTPDPALKAQAQYYLGLAQLKLRNYSSARKVFKEIIAAHPLPSLEEKVRLGLIDGLYMDGNYQEALTQAEAMLKKFNQSNYLSLIYLKIARANLKLAKWQKAQTNLQKIIRDFPQSPEFASAEQLLKEKQFFTVQIGAYKDEAAAQKLVAELKNQGEYAYIVETSVKEGEKVYRVRVGELAVLTDAKKLESKLSGLGYPTLNYP